MSWRATKAYAIWVGEQLRLMLYGLASNQGFCNMGWRATKAQSDYGGRRVFRSLALLDASEWAIKGGVCA